MFNVQATSRVPGRRSSALFRLFEAGQSVQAETLLQLFPLVLHYNRLFRRTQKRREQQHSQYQAAARGKGLSMEKLMIVLLAGAAVTSAYAQTAAPAKKPIAKSPDRGSTQWPTYGHDSGGMRFSPLTQIAPANVANLKPAWVYHMKPEGFVVEQGRGGRGGGRGGVPNPAGGGDQVAAQAAEEAPVGRQRLGTYNRGFLPRHRVLTFRRAVWGRIWRRSPRQQSLRYKSRGG